MLIDSWDGLDRLVRLDGLDGLGLSGIFLTTYGMERKVSGFGVQVSAQPLA